MLSIKTMPPALGRIMVLVLAFMLSFGSTLTFASARKQKTAPRQQVAAATNSPIKYVVVLFQENVSFDHYFSTYPIASNPAGEASFHALASTPTVNNLLGVSHDFNFNMVHPFRFERSEAATCDQDHDYKDEQEAYHAGLLDRFVEILGDGPGTDGSIKCNKTDVMGYYDGNTVTALWNYAQNFALNDNSFGTTFGPSTPGALNVISGQTHGVVATSGDTSGDVVDGTVVSDPQPLGDMADTREAVQMSGTNIGDLLNQKGVTWGWFQGGFADPNASHTGSDGIAKKDYIPHHEPFQYYPQTANPKHLPPSSIEMVGSTDQANHQYDLQDFFDALDAGHLPAVSYLKAPGYEDGHAGYSNPLLEQQYLVDTINRLQQSPEWNSMAIIINWDDSDGWYDHVMPPIVNQSNTSFDALTGADCGQAKAGEYQGRCGYGPRLPLLVISPYAKANFVDHTLTCQTSIVRAIEDNWGLGRLGNQSFDAKSNSLVNMFDFSHRRTGTLLLDPETGQPIQ